MVAPAGAAPAAEAPANDSARMGWLGAARLLVGRALQLGPEEAPEEGPGLGTVVNARGLKLQTRIWPAATPSPRALVVFCHGYGTSSTHLPAWQRVAALLNEHGFVCAGLDYPGHGSSEGRRSRVESIDSLVDDVLQFIDEVLAPQYPTLPVFLRGQSMGGLLAVTAALRCPDRFAGLALGAPAYELRRLVYPFAPRAITAGGAACAAKIGDLTTPIAVFQGVSDWTVAAEGARHLVSGCSSASKALYLYTMGHNMSIEPDVCEWLLSRVDQKGGNDVSEPSSAVLYVRKPATPGSWKPPPPGSQDANEGTVRETITEPAQQAAILDELLLESAGLPL